MARGLAPYACAAALCPGDQIRWLTARAAGVVDPWGAHRGVVVLGRGACVATLALAVCLLLETRAHALATDAPLAGADELPASAPRSARHRDHVFVCHEASSTARVERRA